MQQLKRTWLQFLFFLFPLFASAQFTHPFLPGDSLFKEGSIYRTWNIRFPQAKWEFEMSSEPVLDSIITFLKKNQTLTIQIKVYESLVHDHSAYDFQLKLKREQVIMEYLEEKGIESERLLGAIAHSENGSHRHKSMMLPATVHPDTKRVEFIILRNDYVPRPVKN